VLLGYIILCRRSRSQNLDLIAPSLDDVRSTTGKSHSTSSAMRCINSLPANPNATNTTKCSIRGRMYASSFHQRNPLAVRLGRGVKGIHQPRRTVVKTLHQVAVLVVHLGAKRIDIALRCGTKLIDHRTNAINIALRCGNVQVFHVSPSIILNPSVANP
jgi:hypothetical protein